MLEAGSLCNSCNPLSAGGHVGYSTPRLAYNVKVLHVLKYHWLTLRKRLNGTLSRLLQS